MNAVRTPDPSAAASSTDLKVLPRAVPDTTVTSRSAGGVTRVRHRTRGWVVGLLIAFALLAGAGEMWRASRATVTVRYVTAPVTRGSVMRTVTASGSVNPLTTIQVGTYVSGVIQELYCDYNTQVKKGQLCARIDPRPYQTIVDQDRANLATARAQLAKDRTNLAYAKLTRDRTTDLHARGIVSQDALDAATSAYDQAAAQVDLDTSSIAQHEAVLKAGQINLGYTNIISPVNGTVVSRNVTMGQTVAASFQTPTLFLIATDLTKMEVDANVSETDIGGIGADNSATFTVEAFANHVFQGQVIQVRQAPQTVQNVVTYDVVISVPNPELLLKPGMTATVHIIVEHRDNVIRVPDQALRYVPGGLSTAANATAGRGKSQSHVWVLRDGKPAEVSVTVGLDDDTYAEIVRGDLQVGDQIVTSEQAGSKSSPSSSRPPSFRL